MDILAEVQEIFKDVFDDDELVITGGTAAEDIEDWDSLSNIRLVVAMEKRFEIKFSLGELQSLKNVGEIIDLIIEKSNKSGRQEL